MSHIVADTLNDSPGTLHQPLKCLRHIDSTLLSKRLLFWSVYCTRRHMKWTHLRSEAQLIELEKESEVQAVLIYKHSNRCHVCTRTLRDLERNWNETYDTSL